MTSARRQPNDREEQQRARPREADIVSMPMPQQQQQPSSRPRETQVERIGDILRRTREMQGHDLQSIADYLCIRRAFLEALENSLYEEFPADAYVVGFLRSYSELLGLDSRKAIDVYRAEMAGRRKKPSLTLPTPITEGRSPSMLVMIGAVLAALVVYLGWYSLSTSDRATVSMAPPLPSTPAEMSTPITSTGASAPTSAPTPSIALSAPPPPESMAPAQPAAAPAADNSKPATADANIASPDVATAPEKPPHLVIKAQQSSWVLVAEPKGKTLFDRVLKPGETFVVPDKPNLMLTTGNGSALVLTLDGVDLPKLSNKPTSGIMRDISLDTGHLKAMSTPKDKD